MRKIWAIALNTFREAIRDKILYSLLFFAVAVIVASLAFGALSVHEEVRLTTDLGFAGMSFFLIVIAVVVGVTLVYKELERKTIYTLIPKPVYRFQFVLGKYTGLVLTLLVQTVLMALVLLVVLALQGAELGVTFAQMTILIFCEVLVITAVAIFFSSYSTPFLSGAFTLGVFILGRSVPDIEHAARRMDNPALATLLKTVSRIAPDLRYFYASGSGSVENHLSVHGTFVDWGYVSSASLYALFYVGLLLLLAIALFARRDFI